MHHQLYLNLIYGDLKNTHNVLANNLFESEEIYNIILNKYQYPNDYLKIIYRGMNQMIYQEFHVN